VEKTIEAILTDLPRPTWDASLSSMWAINNFPGLNDFCMASRRMGFSMVELNHQVDSHMLDGIERSQYRFSSLHAPCPADISEAELKARDWLVSSLEEDNRIQGVRAITRTIDLAQELGARDVIVHCGNVNMSFSPENELRQLFVQGQMDSPRFQELRHRILVERAARAPAHLEAVRRSLVELAEYSSRLGVRLGLENRYHLYNIPIPDEMAWLLEALNPDVTGFWYDVGHAQALDRLGIFPHETWLERFNHRLIGVHFHDVRGIDDHYAPGLGEVDWSLPARYLPQGIIRTLEVKPHNTPREVISGITRLVEAGLVYHEK
jgi:sugar phosphate isomerase/epimerase